MQNIQVRVWLTSGRNLFIASPSSYLLHFCIIINLIPTKETVLGKLIFERVAGHIILSTFIPFSFQSPPSNHESTKEEPQKASAQTDRFSQSVGLWLQVLQEQVETSAMFSVSFLLCFFCFIGKGTIYIDKIKWNYMKLHLFILQMLCRNWNRESGYVAFSFSCSHKVLPEMIQNNVTSLKSTELLWLTLFVPHSLDLKQKLWKENKITQQTHTGKVLL